MSTNVFLEKTVADSYDAYYDSPLGSMIDAIEKEVIAGYLKSVKRQPVLETGCGTGHWSEFLSTMGFDVTAVDISDAMLAVAKRKNIDNVRFLNADASNLPFGNESFGVVVTVTMLEFTVDTQKVLSEIYRVLKPGGVLIAGCLNIRSELGRTKDGDETFGKARFFSKEELHNILLPFGDAEIRDCVYLTPAFELLDGKIDTYPVEGSFLAARVQKTK